MSSPKEGLMFDIKPFGVDLVKRPANKREFLLTKNQGEEMEELLQIVMETEAENEDQLVETLKAQDLDEKTIESAKAVARLFNAYSDDLTEKSFRAIAETLGFDLSPEEDNDTDTGDDVEPDTIDKSDLEDLPAEIRKGLEAVIEKAERVDDLEKRVQKAEDEKRLGEFIEKAEELSHLNRKAEELGELLKTIADAAGDETVENVIEVLTGANKLVEESGAFEEIGTAGGGVGGDAVRQLEARAEELRKSNDSLTKEQAFAKAAIEHPELYAAYQRDRNS